MCGIAGIVLKKQIDFNLKDNMQKILTLIAHRGPDGEGIYSPEENIILGHRRLAILDLSSDGHQPMQTEDKQLSIVFNGEIYNYLEIKNELEKLGYLFTTKTDTEVILKAYQHWGKDCIQRFNGMWAFAIYDKQKKQIFCARDRFGVKPFYFINHEKFFIFCSEIKGLLPYLKNKIANQDLLIDYLLTSKTNHTSETFFKDIYTLKASHTITLCLKNLQISENRYYEIKPRSNTSDYIETLHDAVKLRLRSDVAVGTCLSGGLDSSSITALASPIYQQKANRKFQAITAISEQKSNDESDFAKQVVDFCHLDWITTKPSYEDFKQILTQVMYAQEEPFSSPSIIMQYFVMQTAKKNRIPVLLDGQGGDETLLGYERYLASHALHQFNQKGIIGFQHAINQYKQHNQKLSWIKIAQYMLGTYAPNLRYHAHRLEHTYLKKIHKPLHLQTYSSASKNLFEFQKLEMESTNLPALLRFEDKNSMANSIETRLPFLDYRVVEIALSLPFDTKMHQGWSKHILRKSMQNKLPDSIIWRKNKFGFEAPEKIWLNKHHQIMTKTILESNIIKNLCDISNLQKKIGHMSNRNLWRLYTIALWSYLFDMSDLG